MIPSKRSHFAILGAFVIFCLFPTMEGIADDEASTIPCESLCSTYPLMEQAAKMNPPSACPAGPISRTEIADNARANLATDHFFSLWDNRLQNFPQPSNQDRQSKGGAGYWFYAHAIDVAVMAVERNCVNKSSQSCQKYKAWLNKIYLAEFNRIGSSGYMPSWHDVDDESWMAIALTRAYEATGNKQYLTTAQTIFANLKTVGTSLDHNDQNGLVWNNDKQTLVAQRKNTCSNGSAVVAASELYLATKNQSDLKFAENVYDYWRNKSHMVTDTKVNGVPALKACDTSSVVNGKQQISCQFPFSDFSYDTGVMAGAAASLYRITHNQKYLQDVRGYVSYILEHYSSRTSPPVLQENECMPGAVNCYKAEDLALFKGVTYRFLAQALAIDPSNSELRAFLVNTDRSLWNKARDPQSGLYSIEWQSGMPRGYSVGGEISAAIALNALPLAEEK